MTRLVRFSNNAVSRLAANITNASTTISLTPGDGAKFPFISGTQFFMATLIKSTGETEIVKVTARATDTLTVVRAAEPVGATQVAYAFSAGDRIEQRLTAKALSDELDRLDSGANIGATNKTANYTVQAADVSTLIRVDTTAGAITITLPEIASLADDFDIMVAKVTDNINAVNIVRAGSTDLINGATSYTVNNQWQSAWLIADRSTNTWTAINSGAATSSIAVDTFTGDGTAGPYTLSGDPMSKANTAVYLSGVYQQKATYTLSGTSLTMGGNVPVGVTVEVVWSRPLSIGRTDAGLVSYDGGTVQDVLDAVTGPTGAASVGYTPAGTGAVATTVQTKLLETVSVFDFMTAAQIADVKAGTALLDMSAAIQAAVNAHAVVYFPSGSYKINTPVTLNVGNYIWTQNAKLLGNVGGGSDMLITANNTVVDGFSFDAAPSGSTLGVRLTGADVVVKNCSFYNISYCIHLYPCKSVLIDNNYFENIGYGIINRSASGYVFDGIVISNNRGLDCGNDMILFNTNSESYAGLSANNITVIGNVYTKSAPPTATATESRFCGFVHGTNITITGNVVYGTKGDSAMHYEGSSVGDVDDSVTITNNVFRDCVSNYSRFIWLINNTGYRHVNISGNTFEVTSATSGVGSATYISWGDTVTDEAHSVIGNIFRFRRNSGDTSTVYGTGISDAFAFKTIISNNQFFNLEKAISNSGTTVNTNTQIIGNRTKGCGYGIYSGSASYSFDGIISCNVFDSTVTNDIYLAKLSDELRASNNIFTSVAKSINNKNLVLLKNCRDNQNANFGRQQELSDLTKATDYSLGYVGFGNNNLLINATAEWQPSAGANFDGLTSIVGRGGSTATASLNTKQNNTVITGITYSITSGVLYANIAASASAGTNDIKLVIDVA